MADLKKSQSAIEFVILVSFMLGVFMLFFSISGYKIIGLKADKDRVIAQNFMSTIENEFKTAASVKDGYSRVFTLPDTIDGIPYSIAILGSRELIVNYRDEEYLAFLPSGIVGNISSGSNRITKDNGVITITNST